MDRVMWFCIGFQVALVFATWLSKRDHKCWVKMFDKLDAMYREQRQRNAELTKENETLAAVVREAVGEYGDADWWRNGELPPWDNSDDDEN
jgi:hypothetical protein